jgi:FlaG/FlaF family flagellin (archaellin)
MFNKKAIEPVVATVLLIVITIAIVGVVVAFLIPYITSLTDKQTACQGVSLSIDETGTFTNSSGAYVMVELLSKGDYNISRIVAQATALGQTKTNQADDIKNIGEARTIFVNAPNAIKVGAIPYIEYKNKEYACENSKVELLSVPSR